MRGHIQAILFRRPIHIGWHDHAVPVDQLRRIRQIVDFHCHCYSLLKPDERTGRGAVISNRADGVVLRHIYYR